MTRTHVLAGALAPLALLMLCPPACAEEEVASLSLGVDRTSGVARVAISPDGKQVAALIRGGWDDNERADHIRVLDLKTNKEVARVRPGWGNARGLLFAYTPDGKHLVCSSEEAVYVYDAKTRKLARRFTTRAAAPHHAALSSDGKTLVTGDDQRLGVYELTTGKELAGMEAPEPVRNVAVSRDGKRVAAAHRHGKVTVWEVKGRKILHKFEIKGGGGASPSWPSPPTASSSSRRASAASGSPPPLFSTTWRRGASPRR